MYINLKFWKKFGTMKHIIQKEGTQWCIKLCKSNAFGVINRDFDIDTTTAMYDWCYNVQSGKLADYKILVQRHWLCCHCIVQSLGLSLCELSFIHNSSLFLFFSWVCQCSVLCLCSVHNENILRRSIAFSIMHAFSSLWNLQKFY